MCEVLKKPGQFRVYFAVGRTCFQKLSRQKSKKYMEPTKILSQRRRQPKGKTLTHKHKVQI